MTLVIRSTARVATAGLPLLKRDPLLRDDYNDGVRFVADLAFPWCFSGTSPVVNGAIVKDLSEHSDGAFQVTAGQAPVVAGGGVDFSPLTARGAALEIPAGVAASIKGTGQKYLVCQYMRMPAEADWNTEVQSLPFITWGSTSHAWQNGPDLVSIVQATQNGTKQLLAQRQTAVGAQDTIAFSPIPAGLTGQFAQIAFWRNAAGCALRIRTASGTFLQTGPVGADNSADFSAAKGIAGIGLSYWGLLSYATSSARKFRLFRNFVENLALSGRDPATVLDADWERVTGRAVYS